MFKLEFSFQIMDEDRLFSHFEWKFQWIQQIGGDYNNLGVGAY